MKHDVELPEMNIEKAMLQAEEEQTDMDKIFELLLDPNNIAHNTELNRNEIMAFSVLGSISEKRPQLEALREFLKKNLIYRVSKNRQGRKEWVKILGKMQQHEEFEQQRGIARLFRRPERRY